MGRIRRWLRGTLRADRFEADEVDAGSVNTGDLTVTGSATGVRTTASIPADVSGEYLSGTWYQNTDGADKIYSFTVRQTISGDNCGGEVDINDSQSENLWVREVSYGTGGNEVVAVVFRVPSGAYWRFKTINGGINFVKEVTL